MQPENTYTIPARRSPQPGIYASDRDQQLIDASYVLPPIPDREDDGWARRMEIVCLFRPNGGAAAALPTHGRSVALPLDSQIAFLGKTKAVGDTEPHLIVVT